MQNRIFRKVALDRLSSPEQLDQLMQITSPQGWLALIGIGTLLTIGIMWAIFGRIPEEIAGQGVLLQQEDGSFEAVIYMPLANTAEIEAGLDAKIELSTVRTENHGFLKATVISRGDSPAQTEDIIEAVGSSETAAALGLSFPVIEIRLALRPDTSTATGYEWTSANGPPDDLIDGTLCIAQITVEEERPISRVFPIFAILHGLTVLGLQKYAL